MSCGIAENIVEFQESAPDDTPVHMATSGTLRVTECVPNGYYPDRLGRLRVNHVGTMAEALTLPWVQRFPGEKRIKFLHGQVFVIQEYLGWKVIRAHISQTQACWEIRQNAAQHS
jgi:hypothetical protein